MDSYLNVAKIIQEAIQIHEKCFLTHGRQAISGTDKPGKFTAPDPMRYEG